nr:hypothetical protein [Curtobacterium sp. Csp1]
MPIVSFPDDFTSAGSASCSFVSSETRTFVSVAAPLDAAPIVTVPSADPADPAAPSAAEAFAAHPARATTTPAARTRAPAR